MFAERYGDFQATVYAHEAPSWREANQRQSPGRLGRRGSQPSAGRLKEGDSGRPRDIVLQHEAPRLAERSPQTKAGIKSL